MKTRLVAKMPANMISPPIVGVPAFFRWDFSSSRSVCPTFSFLKNGIMTGPDNALIAKAINTGAHT